MVACMILTLVGGYQVFLDGYWDGPSFAFSYFSVGLFPVLYIGWKAIWKTKIKKAHEIDLEGEVEEVSLVGKRVASS